MKLLVSDEKFWAEYRIRLAEVDAAYLYRSASLWWRSASSSASSR